MAPHSQVHLRKGRESRLNMVSEKLKVTNSQGFHMRPATLFVNEMAKFGSDVTILFNGNKVNAKSLMNLIAACIKFGAEIEVQCSGDDEEAALAKAKELITSGLGEE